MGSLAAANAEFCFNLFREMDSNHSNGNVFFSSLSLFTALALVRLGARGDCAAQIDQVTVDFAAKWGGKRTGLPKRSQSIGLCQ